MRGWIKCEVDLFGKPEVLVMARALSADDNQIVGACLRFWAWADSHTPDGFVPGVSLSDVDRMAGLSGLAAAMVQCGWLRENPVDKPVGVMLMNFARHNGESAKARALHAVAQQKYRAKQR